MLIKLIVIERQKNLLLLMNIIFLNTKQKNLQPDFDS